jgi:hypothetical protein
MQTPAAIPDYTEPQIVPYSDGWSKYIERHLEKRKIA